MTNAPTYAIASILNGEAYAATIAIWDDLERRHGLRAARNALYPHITFVFGECAGESVTLASELAAAAAAIAPLDVLIDGVGSFEGPSPVLFLRVLRDERLSNAHAVVAAAARRAGLLVREHYTPEAWVPHVTIGFRDVTPAQLPALRAELAARPTRYDGRLDSVSLVEVSQSGIRYSGTFPLGASGPDVPRERSSDPSK